MQWDPDHSPSGNKLERRAIQLGLQGEVARKYSREWIVSIADISEFVDQPRQHVISENYDQLLTPYESAYPVSDPETARRLQLA